MQPVVETNIIKGVGQNPPFSRASWSSGDYHKEPRFWQMFSDFPGGSVVESACQCRRREFDPWVEKSSLCTAAPPSPKEKASGSSILAWEIPWTEEPDGLQSMGSQRVKIDTEGHVHQDHSKPPQNQQIHNGYELNCVLRSSPCPKPQYLTMWLCLEIVPLKR